MNYDSIIIGGGISGYTCAIKCASEGLRTLVISGGMNSLHFSSGSIDLAGYTDKNSVVKKPFDEIKKICSIKKTHPYSRVGIKKIRESIDFFTKQTSASGLNLFKNSIHNHFHVTPLGTLKPTYLSQSTVFSEKIMNAFMEKKKISIINFESYRDFFESITLENIKKNSLFNGIEIVTGKINLAPYMSKGSDSNEFRSIDIARIFNTERFLPRIAEEIKKISGDAAIAALPAFAGIENHEKIFNRLQELTGILLYESPALPPSILGIRIDNALKKRFIDLGGELLSGDRVLCGKIENNMVKSISTKNNPGLNLNSKFYCISTGSFFSGGLKSEFNRLYEPVFNLKFSGSGDRNMWRSKNFFDRASHSFFEYGVETNSSLNPYDENGKPVKNLFASGSILAGYNPVREANGSGVAIATGYFAADKIIRGIKTK